MIKLFQPEFDKPRILKEISECLDNHWTGLGYKTDEFEKAFIKYTNAPNALFLNSGTAAIQLALKHCLDNYDDCMVYLTPFSFIGVTHTVKQSGLPFHFIDIDKSLCMSPESLKACIASQADHLKPVVIYTGIGGSAANLREISDIVKEYKGILIIDAAHMMGTKYLSEHICSRNPNDFSYDFVVYSFHSVKNLPTADSGMLVCKDTEVSKHLRKLAWFGINKNTYEREKLVGYNWEYRVEDFGYKLHGNSIMAAMALAGLDNLEDQNDTREWVAEDYDFNFTNATAFARPWDYNTRFYFASNHLYQLLLPDQSLRDCLIIEANKAGFELGVHYKAHTEYPIYSASKGSCPNAEDISHRVISLPIGIHLTYKNIRQISRTLLNASYRWIKANGE